jgi:hypothetical protein
MTAGEDRCLKQGILLGHAIAVVFQMGGGEEMQTGWSFVSYGETPMRASDRILRVGPLRSFVSVSGVEFFGVAGGGVQELLDRMAGSDEFRNERDDADGVRDLSCDLAFMRGFGLTLSEYGIRPTVEQQRIEGSNTTTYLLAAVKHEQRKEVRHADGPRAH